MWTVMMIAMMLPSLTPMLSGAPEDHSNAEAGVARIALARAGYFSVWIALGIAIYPLGAAFAAASMRSANISRMVPYLAAISALFAALVQLSRWKACRLRHCRAAARCRALPLTAGGAWRRGVRLGIDCLLCCLPFTTMLLVAGVMNIGAMTLITAAITAEWLPPAGGCRPRIGRLHDPGGNLVDQRSDDAMRCELHAKSDLPIDGA
jgi:predicted metal-binding membrane protein